MAAVSKFLFETVFDAGAERARGGARKVESRAFTASDLEAAKASAYAEGAAAGRAEAEHEAAQTAAAALCAIGAQLERAFAESAEAHAARAREAIATLKQIVQLLLPALAKREALAEIEALVADCLARVHGEPRLVVRVADGMLDPLRQRIDRLSAGAGFGGRVVLLADAVLGETDARVEWADGGADRDAAAVWRDVESAIQRFVQDGPAAPDPSRS